jgi:hypothetical protein
MLLGVGDVEKNETVPADIVESLVELNSDGGLFIHPDAEISGAVTLRGSKLPAGSLRT